MLKFDEFMKIKEAAKLIGVTPTTLRLWEARGKISSYRNPVNNWRMYKRDEIEALLKNIQPVKGANGSLEKETTENR